MDFALRVRNLSKSFPGVRAVSGVSLDVGKGSVHALIGENGAGKSTLAMMLAGFLEPDSGEIFLGNRRIRLRNPHDALRLGISMIHQELLPFPELTVAENIFMGQEITSSWTRRLDRREMQREAGRLMERLGVSLPAARKMRDLKVAEMQVVEIAKALTRHSGVILMDEPTSALSEPEAAALFRIIRDLKRKQVSVIYISHRIEEVLRIADVVTVLRDGRRVDTMDAGRLAPERLIEMMVGRRPASSSPRSAPAAGDVVLKVRDLGRAGVFTGINFELRYGEILGIAGLMGAGRTELACALYGLAPAERGEIRIRDRKVDIASPRDAMAHGLAMVGEDRRDAGIVSGLSLKHNLTLSSLRSYCRAGWIDQQRENEMAESQIKTFSIRSSGPDQKAGTLSGGNQQKVVVARALMTNPEILILDEPTRGIDVGGKAEIHGIIRDLAGAGKAIIVVSSELPEILALSNRILVMREGRISAELDPRKTTQEEILTHAMPCRKPRGTDDGRDQD